ncbi:MAG: response regulator transcription factor [Spirosomaceae bacterium]|nr:response regulator transcription factor [Spirosomataceae bacterium]
MKKLLIIDDHQMFAEGLQFLIEATAQFEIVKILNNGKNALHFIHIHNPDMVILDVNLPEQSGVEVAQNIRKNHLTMKILALSMLQDTCTIEAMLHAGANGYCTKTADKAHLLKAIQKVMEGQTVLPYLAPQQLTQHNIEKLTMREQEIIKLIATGHSSKRIAELLFLSERTVETHRKNIYHKLCIHTNIELAKYAQKYHLV